MSPKELDDVRVTVEVEGFHYAFIHYSEFKEIVDEKFQSLRKAFVKANNELADYLNLKDEMQ